MAISGLRHPVALAMLTSLGDLGERLVKRSDEERAATERQREADAQTARQMAMSTFQQQQAQDANDQSFNRELVTQNYRTLVGSDNPGAAVPVAQGMGGLGARPEVVQGLVGAAQQAQASVEVQRKEKQQAQLNANVVIGFMQKDQWKEALGAVANVTDLKTRRDLAEQGVTYWQGQGNANEARRWAVAGGDRETLRSVDTWAQGRQQQSKADKAEAEKQEKEQPLQDWMAEARAASNDPAQHTKAKGRELWGKAVSAGIAGEQEVRPWEEILTTQWTEEEGERGTQAATAARTAALNLPQNAALRDSLAVDRSAMAAADPAAARAARADSLGRAYAAQNASAGGTTLAGNLTPDQQAVLAGRQPQGTAVPGVGLAGGGGQSLFPETAVPAPTPRRISTPSPAAADTVGLSPEEITYVQAQADKYGITFGEARKRLEQMVKP